MILPNPQPRIDPLAPNPTPAPDPYNAGVEALEMLLAELRTDQLIAARAGRILESAEYADRAHRIEAHLTRPH